MKRFCIFTNPASRHFNHVAEITGSYDGLRGRFFYVLCGCSSMKFIGLYALEGDIKELPVEEPVATWEAPFDRLGDI